MSTRPIPATLSVLIVVSLAAVVIPGVANAAGPSVPLPTTPSVPAAPQTMSPRAADEATTRQLHGDQPAGSAAPEGGGTPTATSLAPSATWQVSAQTGDFVWSYPLRVPPAPGGLEPRLALSYSSSAVDGRTSTTNNQPSWVGDGWDLHPGFVERSYGGCAEDKDGGTVPPKTGDLCWLSDNATAAYNGGGGMLIRDAASGVWRPRSDDGARVERLTGAGNGDNDGEHWRITTVDGTQYLYGSRPEAASTWTVPVFGDDAGEPCHGATFDASSCAQAWRWNLDKVIDRHGNVIVYGYETETNSYGRNLRDAAVSYIRGGTLRRIEYGLHENPTTGASGQVEFGTADRCVPGSTCTLDRKENWPDTPLDSRCVAATCKDQYSPTFWSTKRLATVVTRVWTGSRFADVDSWALNQQFPDPGDGEKAALWLKSITHTGLAGSPGGGQIALPPVTFEGAKLANRVHRVDGIGPLIRFRITGIVSETGGITSISYAPPDCTETSLPANPETNTRRCFPVRWTKKNLAERTDYFHKYAVAAVATSDRIAANPTEQVSYEYLDGAAWHHDSSESTPAAKKTWNEFRGFGRVRIRTGAQHDPAGPIGLSEQRFYRGMHGDRLPGGGTRNATVTDAEGGVHADEDWLQGFALESTRYDGDGGPVVTRTVTEPVWQGPTATRGELKAYLVRPGVERTFTTLEAGGRRATRIETRYDGHGLPTQVNDLADVATADDDRCTRTSYVGNTDRWLWNFPSRTEVVSVHCGQTLGLPGHAISDVRTSYDGHAWGTAPGPGDVTRLEQLAEGPVYATVSTARYDAHGRVLESADALGRTTMAAYTPAVGGPATQTVATNALGHTTTTTLDTAHGAPLAVVDANQRRTESAYDALGRLVEVWLPNRPREAFTGSARFTYLVRNDAPTAITTAKLGPNGRYSSTNTIYDGLLRTRQTQAPAVGGGRLLVDTRYDSQGRAFKTTQTYFNEAPVDTTLWVAADTDVPGLTFTEYDGAGRSVAQIFKGGGQEKWRTTTQHGGDRTHVTLPAGGTATTTITDARGRITELRQYRSATEFDRTTYRRTSAGHLAAVSDPAGNTWQYRYDLRGRQIWLSDPDKGVATSTYDDAGQLLAQTDARGRTLAYGYDGLGRKAALHAGSTGGTRLAAWTYDTALGGKGRLASATSYVNGNAYTSAVVAYSALYKPLQTSVTIPAAAGLLAGVYTAKSKYNVDGSSASESYPAIGDLFAESVFHTYDDAGRPLRTYGGPTGSTVEYVLDTEYTRYGEAQRVHLGESGKRTWRSLYYDDHTRRVGRTIVDAEVPRPMQSDIRYAYDPAGNVMSIADSPLDRPADTQCFRYDYLRRLTEAWTPGDGCAAAPSVSALAGPAPYWQAITYDAVGNRRTETQHSAGGDTTRAYANTGHRLESVTTTGPAGARTDRYGYDPAGNTTNRSDHRLDWDDRGQLVTVTQPGGSTDFVHGADGARMIRRDATGATLYLGGQELRLQHATGALTGVRYYTHGGASVAVRTAAGLSWLAGDHQGTARIAVNFDTQVVTVRRQSPFGEPRGATTVFPGTRGFVGGTTDGGTGLVHIGAREYDPTIGRFLSVDPIMELTDPQQMHGYAYANGNPVTFSDPTGLRIAGCEEFGLNCRTGEPLNRTPPPPPPLPSIPVVDDYCGALCNLLPTTPAAKPRPKPKSSVDEILKPLLTTDGGRPISQAEADASRREAERRQAELEAQIAEDRERAACRASFWCTLGKGAALTAEDISKGVTTLVRESKPGQVLGLVSQATGMTVGVCAGGGAQLGYGRGSASLCYVQSPDGSSAFTFSTSGGGGIGGGGRAGAGPTVSNAQTVGDLKGPFDHYGGSASILAGLLGTVDVGTNSEGEEIWQGTVMPSVGAGGGWETGISYTWVLPH